MAQTRTPGAARRVRRVRAPALPRVLAVVVTHEGRPWLRRCLTALNGQTYGPLDVLVVDDASPSARDRPAIGRIVKRHLRTRRWGFLRTPRAMGFGAAANWALSRVRTDADLLLFVHDDAVLDADAVERMVARILADDKTAIVGPKIVSWDDPDVLEEVGMAIDRLGYPYKGLEQGEIDLGQHDAPSEVFYVTSTCLLVRHELFRHLRGWDARMRAYAEDLDLCWRARIAGHSVRVEPSARARHAIAMASGARPTPFSPARYYIRRNRLRAIAKNVSAPRLAVLVPQFVLLALVEMLAFVVLRQPREIGNLTRALLWNLATLPQTIAERTRVQRRRTVPDRLLGRLQVRAATRLRSYLEGQAERIESAWGRRAEVLAARGTQARTIGRTLSGWTGVAVLVLVLGALLGLRGLLWDPPAAVGELLPFPDRATATWRTFLSPWQPAGLGGPGPAPPALALLGAFPVVAFGVAGAGQKLLLLALAVAGFAGVWRLVAGVVDRPGRAAAALVYSLGGIGYQGIRDGRLGALVVGAAAPFVLLELVRMLGWARPEGWRAQRSIAIVALGSAISAAFVPGSLALYGLAALVLAISATAVGERAGAGRALAAAGAGLAVGWALLLPWSATWWAEGGVLGDLWGSRTWTAYGRSYLGHGMISVALGQTPEVPPLFGLALPLLGLVAVAVGRGQRRRLALGLWAVVAAFGVLVSLTAAGLIRPVVASPAEAGVLVSVAFAGLAGLAVGAFRLDLPERGLGLTHATALFGLAGAGFLAASGAGAALIGGHWDPGRGLDLHRAESTQQIRAVLETDTGIETRAGRGDMFRVLWIGSSWTGGGPSSARGGAGRYTVTGEDGPTMADLFARPAQGAVAALERVVASVEGRVTDRAGELLAGFNIRYVVVDSGPRTGPWVAQRDLARIRNEPGFMMFRNDLAVPRAGVYDRLPGTVEGVATGRTELASRRSRPRYELSAQAPWLFEGRVGGRDGIVFVAEARHPEWSAELGGRDLERSDGGWGNAFTLPAGARGLVEVADSRSLGDVAVLVLQALAWITVGGAALSRRERAAGGAR